jgi:hypothetical protein
MRDRSQTPINHSALIQPEVVREFKPGDLDVDDLAEAIRRLLDSSDTVGSDPEAQANSALHSPPNRASHVMGQAAT